MTKEGLAKVLGHAVIDKNFLNELQNDPKGAADKVNATLDEGDLNYLHGDAKQLKHYDKLMEFAHTGKDALKLNYPDKTR
jgi:hypothetical protein